MFSALLFDGVVVSSVTPSFLPDGMLLLDPVLVCSFVKALLIESTLAGPCVDRSSRGVFGDVGVVGTGTVLTCSFECSDASESFNVSWGLTGVVGSLD